MANDWGSDGRLASRRLYRTSGGVNLSWLTYDYDANDNITSIVDGLDDSRSIYCVYDAKDRLTHTALTAATVRAGTDSYAYGVSAADVKAECIWTYRRHCGAHIALPAH